MLASFIGYQNGPEELPVKKLRTYMRITETTRRVIDTDGEQETSIIILIHIPERLYT